ncbi:hypothetical protein ACFXGT_14940 [Streptomyces sp. NPDC059352]
MRPLANILRVGAHRTGRHDNHPAGVPGGADLDEPDRFARAA